MMSRSGSQTVVPPALPPKESAYHQVSQPYLNQPFMSVDEVNFHRQDASPVSSNNKYI